MLRWAMRWRRQGRRYLFLHPSDELYGADRILLQVLEEVRGQDIEVALPRDVVYPGGLLSSALADRNVPTAHQHLPVLRRQSAGWRSAPRMLRDLIVLMSALVRRRPNVIYLNTSAMLLAAWPARFLGSEVILHAHEVWRPGIERSALGLLAIPCTQIVCVSRAVYEAIPAWLRWKCQVIHNGVPRPPGNSPLETPSRPLTFLVASRWNAWKGHETLLTAWQKVLDRDPDGRKLVILGGPPASGEACSVESLVAQLSLPLTVEIVGEVGLVRPYIEESDCIIVPSLLPDPLPTIAIEAAALGRCVIASSTGGLPEIITHQTTGLLVQPGDSDQLANAILYLDRDSCHRMGISAKNGYERRFSPDRFRARMRYVLGLEGTGN